MGNRAKIAPARLNPQCFLRNVNMPAIRAIMPMTNNPAPIPAIKSMPGTPARNSAPKIVKTAPIAIPAILPIIVKIPAAVGFQVLSTVTPPSIL